MNYIKNNKFIYNESLNIEFNYDIKFNHYSFYNKNILTEGFIEKHKDKINWKLLSFWQDLSEDFIEKHKDKVDWNHISCTQNLSNKFIAKHLDKLNYFFLKSNLKIDKIFIEKLEFLQ